MPAEHFADQIPEDVTADFWNGWLASAASTAVSQLRRAAADGQQLYTREDVARDLERSLDTLLQHPTTGDELQALGHYVVWGWALLDANGELYALRRSLDDARRAKADAESYLDGAATCGHPAAGPWVAQRLPFELRQVTRAQRAELLDEWGTPVLDREP